jgi:hypothetical protein
MGHILRGSIEMLLDCYCFNSHSIKYENGGHGHISAYIFHQSAKLQVAVIAYCSHKNSLSFHVSFFLRRTANRAQCRHHSLPQIGFWMSFTLQDPLRFCWGWWNFRATKHKQNYIQCWKFLEALPPNINVSSEFSVMSQEAREDVVMNKTTLAPLQLTSLHKHLGNTHTH